MIRWRRCAHVAQKVRLGAYEILAGGAMAWTQEIPKADVFFCLIDWSGQAPWWLEDHCQETGVLLHLFPIDGMGCPEKSGPWEAALFEIISHMEQGKTVIVFCVGGHGRTGLALACLLRILEPNIEDSVSEIRRRYCPRAIESPTQEEFVRTFRGA